MKNKIIIYQEYNKNKTKENELKKEMRAEKE